MARKRPARATELSQVFQLFVIIVVETGDDEANVGSRALDRLEGAVELVKLDVDANQALAAQFSVSGIPAVKAFRDGKVVKFQSAGDTAMHERIWGSK